LSPILDKDFLNGLDADFENNESGLQGNDNINEYDKEDSLWIQAAGYKGYYNFDLNYDGQVNNNDKNDFWLPNLGKGSQVPQ